jgi:hypothetical protein
MSITGELEEDQKALEEALKLIWEAIPSDFFNKLIESIPDHI